MDFSKAFDNIQHSLVPLCPVIRCLRKEGYQQPDVNYVLRFNSSTEANLLSYHIHLLNTWIKYGHEFYTASLL